MATGFVADKVKAVIGHYCSGASIPASKVYQKAGIVQISPASTHPKLTDEGGWNVLRLVPRDDAQATAAADLVLAKFPGRKIAVVNDQSARLRRPRPALPRGAAGQGRHARRRPKASRRAPRISTALAGRLASAGCGRGLSRRLLCRGRPHRAGAAGRRALSAQIVSGDSLVTEDFLNQAKDAAEGTLMTFTYDPRNFPAARPVIERMRAEEQNAEGFTLYAYAAVQALAAAAEATGSTESARLAEWLRGGNRFDTAVGPSPSTPKGDLKEPKVAWFRWIGGRYVEIDPATLAPPIIDTTP